MREIPGPSMADRMKKTIRRTALATAAAVGIGVAARVDEEAPAPEIPEQAQSVPEEAAKETEKEVVHPFFDGNPDYLVRFPNGEFSDAEKVRRTKILPNGEEVFEDVGLTFYHVQEGDTVSGVRERLSIYPEFDYLKAQTKQVQSFNLNSDELEPGMWLPIPLENKDRRLTDDQFIKFAERAIDDILSHERYGPAVKLILDRAGRAGLLAAMTAIAKQESGAQSIGDTEWHRYEKRHKEFSLSLFHVMMDKGGPGWKARCQLGMTKGQTYHPKNATELFLAFLVEKCREIGRKPEDLFPLPEHYEEFAVFYNGAKWKKYNPDYVEKLAAHFDAAMASFDSSEAAATPLTENDVAE